VSWRKINIIGAGIARTDWAGAVYASSRAR
jgi:hypothetical protein